MDRIDELEHALEAALDRIARLEARHAAPEHLPAATPTARSDTAHASSPTPEGAPTTATLDRRRLLGRAGTAAVGAVLGGTAAGIAAASPAAAATSTFDTADGSPALTATTSATGLTPGPAIRAISTGSGAAVLATGPSSFDGPVAVTRLISTTGAEIDGPTTITAGQTGSNSALTIQASGSTSTGLVISSALSGALILAEKTGIWAVGDLAVEATGRRLGLLAAGQTAQILLAGSPPDFSMEPPPTRTDAHERGELYFDKDATLWLCVADGTPGTWTRLGGAGTTGAFTVLPTPTRVYDTRPGSGLPGAGTGPVTGIRKNIDLTANNSGLPVDATAAMVTLTATNTQANPQAYGQIYANSLTTPPGTSTINWTQANDLVATTTTTALTAGKVAITMNPAANVLIDVIGYWR